jgi:hypothetical protein
MQDNEASKQARKALYTMLWNAGTRHFSGRAYGACAQLYAAALMYADAGAKPVVARQLALAHMGAGDTDRCAHLLAKYTFESCMPCMHEAILPAIMAVTASSSHQS